MTLSEFVDERIVVALNRTLPGFAFEPILKTHSRSGIRSVTVELPAPQGAEYQFVLGFQPEKQIHARLLPHAGMEQNNYFWYRPFEETESRDLNDKVDAAFISTIERLVHHETRIIQKRGLLNHSFRLDYKSPSGWQRIYRHWAFRLGGFSVPSIPGRQRVYHSPALHRDDW